MATYGNAITELRKSRRLTQADMAAKLKVSVGTVSNYETERHIPDLDTLCWFADFFNVTLDYILGRTQSTFSMDTLNRELAEGLTAGDFLKVLDEMEPENRQVMVDVISSLITKDRYDKLLRGGK